MWYELISSVFGPLMTSYISIWYISSIKSSIGMVSIKKTWLKSNKTCETPHIKGGLATRAKINFRPPKTPLNLVVWYLNLFVWSCSFRWYQDYCCIICSFQIKTGGTKYPPLSYVSQKSITDRVNLLYAVLKSRRGGTKRPPFNYASKKHIPFRIKLNQCHTGIRNATIIICFRMKWYIGFRPFGVFWSDLPKTD